MPLTYLVTGGAGFIGSNYVRYIKEKYPDARIIVLDALTYAGSLDNLPQEMNDIDNQQYVFWYGNVCNGELVDTLVAQADIVVHFAAESHVTRSIYDNLLFFQTDVLGTQAVANAVLKCKDKVRRFIHISTSEVYGTASHEVMDEEHPLNPMSPYASAKCGADRLVYSYWATYGIPATIVRPFNNFGPRQHLEKVIPRFVTSTILQEPLTVHGGGEAARDFVYVGDVARALDMIVNAADERVVGNVFNVATGVHRSVLDIAKYICKLTGYSEDNIVFTGDRPGQVERHTGNWSKIHDQLGWSPKLSWDEGMQRTIEFYVNRRDWWGQQLSLRSIPIINAAGEPEYH